MSYYQFHCEYTDEPYGSLKCFYFDEQDVRANWCVAEAIDADEPEPALYGALSGTPDSEDGWTDNPADLVGWYWAAGFPGCLWDGDPCGPFTTEQDALNDAGAYQA